MSKERPILFNGAMVRAILAGQKTQTRRVLKMPHGYWETSADGLVPIPAGCPFGQPGDRLWVRETWRGVVNIARPGSYEYAVARYVPDREHCRRVEYAATQTPDSEPWRPSIHMPRWASRLVLEITAVRVERLQAITVQDIAAEGISCYPDINPFHDFEELWTSTGGDWDSNPWVWVLEFKQVTP